MSKTPKPSLSKAYNPAEHEAGIYKLWEDSGAFKPQFDKSDLSLDAKQGSAEQQSKTHKTVRSASSTGNNAAQCQDVATKKPFCIVMPPPNANGDLHCGHAMYTVEDILARHARMQDRPTLWLPGADHAGIETQVVFEKVLAAEGKSRYDLGREEFYKQALAFTQKNKDTMFAQIRSLGFSVDWDKVKFTLDPDILQTVFETFKQMHDDGLIYRGNRIVNWCPSCHSGFADLEIKHREQVDPLYYIKYGPFVVATVRPEPMFADTGIAVHPKDERYQKWIGKEVEVDLLWGPRKLKVVADQHVDPEFGTGVVKLTPAHDHNDWEMALAHGLEVIQGIGTDGTITEAGGRFAGMTAAEGRDEVVKELEAKGLMDHIDMNYTHSIAYHDRCGTQIEPLVTEQWWLKVDELKKPAIEAIKSGKVSFYPTRFKKQALDWLEGLRDWNIGRQNWFGIKIPVYYNATGDTSKPDYIVATTDAEAAKVYGKGGFEPETDTFDTWFSSGQWPFATLQATGEFDQFYPTTVMATMRDILYLWVTRMIMFGLYRTGKVPFEHVYLWGAVNDAQGKKMSKSKGNVINPLEMTGEFGTDALRLALTIGITPGTGGSLSTEKIRGYRNFCNKLWNVARYTLDALPDDFKLTDVKLHSPADHWIVGQTNAAIKSVSEHIEAYRFSEAGQAVYSLLWDDLADKYLEYSKSNLNPGVLAYCLDTILRLLHPIAPFVTEAIWQQAMWTSSNLITEQWPNVIHKPSTTKAKAFELEIIEVLAEKQKESDAAMVKSLQKELALKQNMVKLSEQKLANKAFAANAPADVVKAEKQRLAEAKAAVAEIENNLAKLK